MILFVSFLSGILTVLAPCVLPLLPIILGSSLGEKKTIFRPLVIIISLSISVVIFSILLKATTFFIGFDTKVLTSISGLIILLFGFMTIFPNLWKKISTKLSFSDKSNKALNISSNKKGVIGYSLIGISLGPVFSSCSPTYAIILAVILPASFLFGLLNLIFYVLGLAFILLLIAFLGQKFTSKLRGISDPKSKFKKILGYIFLFIGLFIITGFDKKIESFLIQNGFVGAGNIEEIILDKIDYDLY